MDKCNHKTVDFVKGLLQSNVIYFDMDEICGKLDNGHQNDNPLAEVDPHFRYDIMYDELMQQQYQVSKSGMNKHTI